VRQVAYARLPALEKARDKEVFCPGYAQSGMAERLNCWVLLVAGISKYEANLIARDGYIDGPEGRRGAASYWSTLRAPYKRWDPTRNRYLSLGKKNLILPLVRGYRGHKAGDGKGGGKPEASHRSVAQEADPQWNDPSLGGGAPESDPADLNFVRDPRDPYDTDYSSPEVDDRDFYEPR
jgi:hypothetical protein